MSGTSYDQDVSELADLADSKEYFDRAEVVGGRHMASLRVVGEVSPDE